ncbi:flagellar biosynthesis regulator FlaF [Pseudohoeflea coraliihabitans]|uniref:Flagellar biosynthesis regulator FlaF n=1 Tax=Pseudohoeflea coraliihabitans TaxID=2860393 RepID=A0ABS6WN13_9HYPH|nr:flagellar biosynthesis regulator FlaF [Pseudohoeflea sp. DP4N28-3]MBW3097351.1 flagellar biosynthesis regulator FlaF [Pseudohoeflea sp. DP4N28-3]
MYQFSYADVQEDGVAEAREREREAINHSINLLRLAIKKGRNTREGSDAIHFVNRLWVRFVEDLASPENELPDELKANLISIGIWIIKEAERIRHGDSENFQGIIDISEIIREGLK